MIEILINIFDCNKLCATNAISFKINTFKNFDSTSILLHFIENSN